MKRFCSKLASSGMLFFLLPIVLATAVFSARAVKVYRGKSWVAVEGIVTISRSEYVTSARFRTPRKYTRFQYRFDYDGRAYIGRDFGRATTGATVPEGSTVTVFVDPRNPRRASLERPKFHTPPLSLLVIPAFVFFALRRWYRDSESDDRALSDQLSTRFVDWKQAGYQWKSQPEFAKEWQAAQTLRCGEYFGAVDERIEGIRIRVVDWRFAVRGRGGFTIPYFQTVTILETDNLNSPLFSLRPKAEFLERHFRTEDRVLLSQQVELKKTLRAYLPEYFTTLFHKQLDAKFAPVNVVETETEFDWDYILDGPNAFDAKTLFQSTRGRDQIAALIRSHGWTVEWNGTCLVVFRLHHLVDPSELTPHLDAVMQLIDVLRDSSDVIEQHLEDRLQASVEPS